MTCDFQMCDERSDSMGGMMSVVNAREYIRKDFCEGQVFPALLISEYY